MKFLSPMRLVSIAQTANAHCSVSSMSCVSLTFSSYFLLKNSGGNHLRFTPIQFAKFSAVRRYRFPFDPRKPAVKETFGKAGCKGRPVFPSVHGKYASVPRYILPAVLQDYASSAHIRPDNSRISLPTRKTSAEFFGQPRRITRAFPAGQYNHTEKSIQSTASRGTNPTPMKLGRFRYNLLGQ